MAAPDKIFHLVYVSTASPTMNSSKVRNLLYHARKRNGEFNVTGFLTYGDHTFFQLIEGRETDVRTLFRNIAHDDRHSMVKVVC